MCCCRISILIALVLVWQGVPQNLGAYTHVVGLDGFKQLIAQGPVASQEAIKMLGTNGGGFFNANSAHPFESPTWLTNFLEMWALLVIGGGADLHLRPYGEGYPPGLGDLRRDGLLMLAGVGILYAAEGQGNAAVAAAHVAANAQLRQHGRQGSALRRRHVRRCSPPSPPMRPAVRSIPCMTA